MSNSDYLFKAAIKKITEKFSDVLVENIEKASNIAQYAPEKIKKEFDTLKESIIEEAERMGNEINIEENIINKTNQESIITKAIQEIEDINTKIEKLNKKINNQIR